MQSLSLSYPRESGRDMVAPGPGKIVLTASLLSFQSGINGPRLPRRQRRHRPAPQVHGNGWAGKGANVDAIVPRCIKADSTEALRGDPVRSAQISGRIPAGYWVGVDDLKGPVLYPASESARNVHGGTFGVDGRWRGR